MIWRNKLHERFTYHAEKFVVKTAYAVIVTTEGIRNDFVSRYPSQISKFNVITNGYDDDDFKNIIPIARVDSKWHITHAGTLGGERNPKSFLKALRLLIDEYPKLETEIVLNIVGQSTKFRDGK